jgi:hypothetical protein
MKITLNNKTTKTPNARYFSNLTLFLYFIGKNQTAFEAKFRCSPEQMLKVSIKPVFPHQIDDTHTIAPSEIFHEETYIVIKFLL